MKFKKLNKKTGKVEVHTSYKPVVVRPGESKTKTGSTRKFIPDQSMSVQEIIERFSRKMPVHATQRDAVYVNDNPEGIDYEKASRMGFDEKREFAEQMSAKAEDVKAELTAKERAKLEREKEQKAIAEKAEADAKAKDKKDTGIVNP